MPVVTTTNALGAFGRTPFCAHAPSVSSNVGSDANADANADADAGSDAAVATSGAATRVCGRTKVRHKTENGRAYAHCGPNV
jgi:hypothetical protein